MFMKLCGFLHDIQNFPTNWVVFTNNMLYMFSSPPQRKCYGCFLNSNTIVKLQLHFVTWSHYKYHKNSRWLSGWQLTSLAAISELWPSADPSKWRSSEQQLSVLTATVAGPGPLPGGVLRVWPRLQRSELLRLTTHRCSSGPRIIVKNKRYTF